MLKKIGAAHGTMNTTVGGAGISRQTFPQELAADSAVAVLMVPPFAALWWEVPVWIRAFAENLKALAR
jgi:hypothetical protein